MGSVEETPSGCCSCSSLSQLSSSNLRLSYLWISEESSGHRCCAENGLKGHKYWIMGNIPSPWERLDMEGNIEGGKLLILESRRENDCIVKYILDEYKGEPVKSFAIGLKTPQNYKGVYEWRHVDNTGADPDAATPGFSNWSPVSPT